MFFFHLLPIFAIPILLSAETQINPPDCGLRGSTLYFPRVIGGYELGSTHLFPWTAALHYQARNGTNYGYCGGAIINSNWVLTAAHCLDDFKTSDDVSRASIAVGWPNSLMAPTTFTFQIKKMIVSSCLNMRIIDFDIALIQIRESFSSVFSLKGNFPVWTLCLPEQDEPTDTGREYELAGWGRIDATPGSKAARYFHAATLDDYDIDAYRWLQFYFQFGCFSVSPNLIATYNGNTSSCHGDSGSALVQSKVRNNRTVMFGVGIVSQVEHNCNVRNIPNSYFTKLSGYRNWVEDKIQRYDADPADRVIIRVEEQDTVWC